MCPYVDNIHPYTLRTPFIVSIIHDGVSTNYEMCAVWEIYDAHEFTNDEIQKILFEQFSKRYPDDEIRIQLIN